MNTHLKRIVVGFSVVGSGLCILSIILLGLIFLSALITFHPFITVPFIILAISYGIGVLKLKEEER